MRQSRDLKLLQSVRDRRRIVNFTIVHVDHHLFDSIFLGNGYDSPSGFLKNNITNVLAIHLEPLW
jgi:hypothetical protein